MTPFARRLLDWHSQHGRHDLPWQRDRDPYRIWVSEIMLQQTQVAFVIPYFERFIARFPDVTTLADADDDAVMAHWAGLGYYARARNLLQAARIIRDRHDGRFPDDAEVVNALPGIGRSTAGAILALAFGQRHAILDGNCRRVYARHRGVEGWPGETRNLRRLWAIADAETPAQEVAAYTQAIMDLGATVCTRAQPRCRVCPVRDDCSARINDQVDSIPGARPRRVRPTRQATVLIYLTGDREVLLERRPPSGVWGGLWTLPESDVVPGDGRKFDVVRHQFTHFTLEMQPVRVACDIPFDVADGDDRAWVPLTRLDEYGLPTPVRRILAMVESAA